MLGKEDFLFDKRLAERLIKRGSLTRADYQAYLESLPDVTSKGELLSAAEGEAAEGEQASDTETP